MTGSAVGADARRERGRMPEAVIEAVGVRSAVSSYGCIALLAASAASGFSWRTPWMRTPAIPSELLDEFKKVQSITMNPEDRPPLIVAVSEADQASLWM